jgi:hypothetical protein
VSDQLQSVIGSELDEFADFVRGLPSVDDGAEVAERMDRWFEPAGRTVPA